MIIIDYIKVLFALKELNTPFGYLMNWVLMIGISGLTVLSGFILWFFRYQIKSFISGVIKFVMYLVGITPKGVAR